MYRCGTREVVEAQLGKPSAAPNPVAGNRVDYRADCKAVQAVRDKFGALRHGAGNDGCCRGAENGLEDDEGPFWNACRKNIGISPGDALSLIHI